MRPTPFFGSRNVRGIFLACLLALAASAVQGAPAITSVSGTIVNGQSITINGTGFGTKTTAAPVIWDNFESGTNGALILTNPATVGTWETGLGYDVVRYSNARPHAGSMGSVHVFDSNNYNVSLSQNLTFSTVYMDFWWLIDLRDPAIRSSNFKPWRFYGEANDAMTFRKGHGCNYTNYAVNDAFCGVTVNTIWDGNLYNNLTWYHAQIYFKESNPALTANGIAKEYVNNIAELNWTGITRCSDSRHLSQLRIGHYYTTGAAGSCPSQPGASVYFDNVYVDTSWAHVEIANNANWAAATHTEVLIPTSWSDNQVVATVNKGTFGSSGTAYVFIFDPSGVVSSGYPVSLSGTGVAPTVTAVSCSPTANQAPAATNCTASATGDTPITWAWTGEGTNCSWSSASVQSPTLTCSYGGARTPCARATNASGTHQLCTAPNGVVWRYVKPSGLQVQ